MSTEVHHLVFETRAQFEAARQHAQAIPSKDLQLLPSASLSSSAEAALPSGNTDLLAQLTANSGEPVKLYMTPTPLPDATELNLVMVSVTTVIDHQLVTRTEASLVHRSHQESQELSAHG